MDPFEGFDDSPMSLNGYSWVEGNTPNRTDATGMCAQPTQWGNPIDVNCYYSAAGLAQRFSQGDPQAYQAWFEVLIQKDWGELKAIEALGSAADVTGSARQFMQNAAIPLSLMMEDPLRTLEALRIVGCQHNLGFLTDMLSVTLGVASVGSGTLSLPQLGRAVGGTFRAGPYMVVGAMGILLAGLIILPFAGTTNRSRKNPCDQLAYNQYVKCNDLPSDYIHTNFSDAMREIATRHSTTIATLVAYSVTDGRISERSINMNQVRGDTAQEGPCSEDISIIPGRHWNVWNNLISFNSRERPQNIQPIHAISKCSCCNDDAGYAQILHRFRVINR